jgi:hypothetical protein
VNEWVDEESDQRVIEDESRDYLDRRSEAFPLGRVGVGDHIELCTPVQMSQERLDPLDEVGPALDA